MHRWTYLLAALMLVLIFWTGGAAHAAETFECNPVSAEAAGHFEVDSDQTPSDCGQGVGHEHSSCSGHQVAATADARAIDISYTGTRDPLPWREAGVPGRGPDTQLRPPIA